MIRFHVNNYVDFCTLAHIILHQNNNKNSASATIWSLFLDFSSYLGLDKVVTTPLLG